MKKTLKRRRKENKTDYQKRIKLLKGGSPRIVFRKTNKYILGQYIVSKEAQDEIKKTVCSVKLLNYGWPKERAGSLKSITAAYFTGFLLGKEIIKEKMKKPILDFGMHIVLHKSKAYAFMKGLLDAGIDIKHKKETLPEEERIQGKHLKNNIPFKEIKLKIEKL
jgi:large subunit ribosomal protein L18